MSRYCLDANVLIQAKNGPYAFDLVPRFWTWIDEMFEQDTLYSSIMVYNELAEGSDELSAWVKSLRPRGFFVEPGEEVQGCLAEIADYVTSCYEPQQAQIFLAGADPWVIAQSKIDSATVVTQEALVGISSRKVKIPNICEQFDVPYVNTYGIMRALGASFA
jgi:hypothetical protein